MMEIQVGALIFAGMGLLFLLIGIFFGESVWQEAKDRLDGYHGAGSGCGMQKRQWWQHILLSGI